MSNESQDRVQEQAREAIRGSQGQHRGRQFALWMGALIIGAILGWLGIPALNQLFDFIATVFTRLFQFIAVPTIALAVITTLSALGAKKETSRIFACRHVHALDDHLCRRHRPGTLPLDCPGQPAGRPHQFRRFQCPAEIGKSHLLRPLPVGHPE